MSKSIKDQKTEKDTIEKQTTIEKPKQITIPLVNGCLVPIAVFALMILCVRECKRSGVRLEQEQFKLEQMKKGAVVDTTPVITPDTLKIGSFQKAYIPLSKMYKDQNQK